MADEFGVHPHSLRYCLSSVERCTGSRITTDDRNCMIDRLLLQRQFVTEFVPMIIDLGAVGGVGVVGRVHGVLQSVRAPVLAGRVTAAHGGVCPWIARGGRTEERLDVGRGGRGRWSGRDAAAAELLRLGLRRAAR